jgi:hypothetical protein
MAASLDSAQGAVALCFHSYYLRHRRVRIQVPSLATPAIRVVREEEDR